MIKTFDEFFADQEYDELEEGKLKNIALTSAAAAGIVLGAHHMPIHKTNDINKEEPEMISMKNNPGINFYPSNDILEYIKKAEGWHQGWKNDGKGNKTTGWGFKITDDLQRKYPNGMTKEQANKYFDDIAIPSRVKEFVKSVPCIDKYTQHQLDALFDLFYNIGYGKFTKGSPALQMALSNYDIDSIIKEMDHDYNNKKVPGARIRRDYERNLFLEDS